MKKLLIILSMSHIITGMESPRDQAFPIPLSQQNAHHNLLQGADIQLPKLFTLMEMRDGAGAEYMLRQNPLLATVNDSKGCMALHIAALYFTQRFVKRLVEEYKTPLMVHDTNGNTPLHYNASSIEAKECTFSYLLDTALARGENPLAKNNYGQTVVHSLCRYGAFDKLLILMQKVAPETFAHLKDNDGFIPAHYCMRGPRMDEDLIFKAVLPLRPDLVLDKNNQTLLHHAAQNRQPRIMVQLLPHISINAVDNKGKTAFNMLLETSTLHDDPFVFAPLIQDDLDVHHTDSQGNSYLHYAALKKHIAIIIWLLSKGLKGDICNNEGKTPLAFYIAFSEKPLDLFIAQELINRGASLDAVDNQKNTLLHLAASYGHKTMAEELIKRKASTLARNGEGKMPIDLAIVPHIRTLLEEAKKKELSDTLGSEGWHGF